MRVRRAWYLNRLRCVCVALGIPVGCDACACTTCIACTASTDSTACTACAAGTACTACAACTACPAFAIWSQTFAICSQNTSTWSQTLVICSLNTSIWSQTLAICEQKTADMVTEHLVILTEKRVYPSWKQRIVFWGDLKNVVCSRQHTTTGPRCIF